MNWIQPTTSTKVLTALTNEASTTTLPAVELMTNVTELEEASSGSESVYGTGFARIFSIAVVTLTNYVERMTTLVY